MEGRGSIHGVVVDIVLCMWGFHDVSAGCDRLHDRTISRTRKDNMVKYGPLALPIVNV